MLFSSRDAVSNSDSCNSLARLQQPRIVYVKKDNSEWGFNLIGGNTVGIFVDDLKMDSPAFGPDGLRNGDQIFEVINLIVFNVLQS